LESRQEEVANSLFHIIQRANDSEGALALRCASLIAISLSEGTQFKQQMTDSLSKLIKDDSGAITPTLRSAIIETLAMMYFMNSSFESEQILAASYTVSSIFYEDGVEAHVCRAAIDAWALLLTLIEDDVIQETLFPENIEKLNVLLDSSDYEVRVATGKSIALLVEALRNQLKSSDEFQKVELDDIASPVSWDDMMGKLDFLSMEKSKSQSKIEGKKQKKSF